MRDGDECVRTNSSDRGQVSAPAPPAWQRRGIARALLQRALMHFREQSIPEGRLYTDAANGQGARSLYESLGFREVKQYIFYRKLLDDACGRPPWEDEGGEHETSHHQSGTTVP